MFLATVLASISLTLATAPYPQESSCPRSVLGPVLRLQTLLAKTGTPITDTRIIGFHGTSWEAFQAMVRSGVLPASNIEPGIRIAPIQLNLASKVHDWDIDSFRYARGVAQDYARLNSQRHFFLKALGLKIGNPVDDIAVQNLVGYAKEYAAPALAREAHARLQMDYEDFVGALGHFEKMGFDRKTLLQLLMTAETTRLGVLLGIDASVLKAFAITKDTDEGLLIHLPPGGMDIKYIRAIEPLGPFEQNQIRIMAGQK